MMKKRRVTPAVPGGPGPLPGTPALAVRKGEAMYQKTVVTGAYPQNSGMKKEPVEWIVLKEEEGRCLCVSRYLLDCKPYHTRSERVTWRDCALRSWLNHDFLMQAFSAEEREKILLSTVENPAGNTQDYMFLLSTEEVEALFDDEAEDYVDYEERGALTTAFARSQGAWFMDEDCEEQNRGCWWLRYYGDFRDREEGAYDFISCVNFDGYIERAAQGVEETDSCVRPAFWLRTD